MDSRGILELALDLENGKRPCAEYGGGGDERCKYYSHGTLADEMARLCCTGSNSLAIFVLKLREFTSSRPCDCGNLLMCAARSRVQVEQCRGHRLGEGCLDIFQAELERDDSSDQAALCRAWVRDQVGHVCGRELVEATGPSRAAVMLWELRNGLPSWRRRNNSMTLSLKPNVTTSEMSLW